MLWFLLVVVCVADENPSMYTGRLVPCLYPILSRTKTGSGHTIQGISLDMLCQRFDITLWGSRHASYQPRSKLNLHETERASFISLEAWRQIFRLAYRQSSPRCGGINLTKTILVESCQTAIWGNDWVSTVLTIRQATRLDDVGIKINVSVYW